MAGGDCDRRNLKATVPIQIAMGIEGGQGNVGTHPGRLPARGTRPGAQIEFVDPPASMV
jgi:hypothetical protein